MRVSRPTDMAALSTFTRISSGRYETESNHIILCNNSGSFSQGRGVPSGVGGALASLTQSEASRFEDISIWYNDRSLDTGRTCDRFPRRFKTPRAPPGALLRFKFTEGKTLRARASPLGKIS